MLQEEAAKRNQLENILAEMEGRLVQGATVFEEKEREQAKAQRKLAKELEEEKKRQKKMLEDQERMEEEMIEKDRVYNSM